MEVGGRARYLFSLDIRQIRVFCTVDTHFEHGTLKLKGKNLQSHVKEDIVLEKKTFHFNQVRYST